MRTAMIAALSCALLCGPCAALHAQGYQCESGQASLRLQYVGHYDGIELAPEHSEPSPFELYQVQVFGKSTLDYADVPGVQGVDSLKIHLVVAQNSPVELAYRGRGDLGPNTSLNFDYWWRRRDETTALFWVMGEDARHYPRVDFSVPRDVMSTLSFAVNPAVVKDAAKLKASDVRVYIEGKRKSDAKSFTLFDTSKPCKE